MEVGTKPVLIAMVGTRACALPIEHVAETMRPMPVERIPGAPGFVLGVSVIRGEPIPVIDAEALIDGNGAGSGCERFVTIKLGDRRAALAVKRVVGIRMLDAVRYGELPRLLSPANDGLIESIGASDEQIVTVLRAARVVPDGVWDRTAGAPGGA